MVRFELHKIFGKILVLRICSKEHKIVETLYIPVMDQHQRVAATQYIPIHWSCLQIDCHIYMYTEFYQNKQQTQQQCASNLLRCTATQFFFCNQFLNQSIK